MLPCAMLQLILTTVCYFFFHSHAVFAKIRTEVWRKWNFNIIGFRAFSWKSNNYHKHLVHGLMTEEGRIITKTPKVKYPAPFTNRQSHHKYCTFTHLCTQYECLFTSCFSAIMHNFQLKFKLCVHVITINILACQLTHSLSCSHFFT